MVQGMGPEERMSHTGPGRVGFRLSGLLCSLLLVTVVACKKKPIVEEVVEEISIYPELGCLEGTKAVGTPPPMGTEVWCATTQEGNSYRNGAAIEWYNNEQRKSAGSYENGMKSGQWEFWYPHGVPQEQGTFVRGVKDGYWTEFNPSGGRSSEGQMVAGKEHGKWIYWQDDGSRTEGEWVLGQKTGKWIDFGTDDKPMRERIYRNGRMLSQRELGTEDEDE